MRQQPLLKEEFGVNLITKLLPLLPFTISTSSSGSFHRNLYLLEVSIMLAAVYLWESRQTEITEYDRSANLELVHSCINRSCYSQ